MAIQDIFDKHKIEDHLVYGTNELWAVLHDLNITKCQRDCFIPDWMNFRKRKGILIMPPREKWQPYRLTGRQIKLIVRNFLPGGIGTWDYRDYEPKGKTNSG